MGCHPIFFIINLISLEEYRVCLLSSKLNKPELFAIYCW